MFSIPPVSPQQLQIALSAEIGAESRVFISDTPTMLVGTINQTGPNTGTFTAAQSYVPPTGGAPGYAMVIRCATAAASTGGPIQVTLATLLASGAGSALGIFNPPFEDDANDPYNLPAAIATDLVAASLGGAVITNGGENYATAPTVAFVVGGGTGATATATIAEGQVTGINITAAGTGYTQVPAITLAGGGGNGATAVAELAGENILSIAGVTSITNGASGNTYDVLVIPPLSTFNEIQGATKKDVVPNTRKSMAIPNRYNAAYWVKGARGEVPKLDVTAAHTGFASGLARLDGQQQVTALIEVWKEDQVLVERHFLIDWYPQVNTNRPDGDGKVEDVATGMYLSRAVFC